MLRLVDLLLDALVVLHGNFAAKRGPLLRLGKLARSMLCTGSPAPLSLSTRRDADTVGDVDFFLVAAWLF